MQINKFSYTEFDQLLTFLKPFYQLRDYRYFFSSREWISAYISAYKPEMNYLFTEGSNYFILSKSGDNFSFCGKDLNDYNGIDNVDSRFKFNKMEVLSTLLELEYPILITQVFESDFNDSLNAKATGLKSTESVLVTPTSEQSFQMLMSKRIRKMYLDHGNLFSYHRHFLNDSTVDVKKLLSDMLLLRQLKMRDRYSHEPNSSFFDEFIGLIIHLAGEDSLGDNMFIDVSYSGDRPIVITVNFIYKGTIMNYLRYFVETDQVLSIGLMLDYWASAVNNKNDIVKLDLLRGSESYKYRLGGKSYFLNNFKLNDNGK